MKATARKKTAFKDFYENGMFSRIIATRTSNNRWQLCGIHRNGNALIFIEAAMMGYSLDKIESDVSPFWYCVEYGL
ncbi:hypothetical protein V7P28_31335, partial [Klebsiella michiganensis]